MMAAPALVAAALLAAPVPAPRGRGEPDFAVLLGPEERALLDWPEPQVPAAGREALQRAQAALDRGQPQAALVDAGRLAQAYPGWRAPRLLRAQALMAAGHYDQAERELTLLTQLAPSLAEAWRRLGRILARHGGALDAERADEALRQALALEPGHYDLWLLRAQVAVRRGRPDEARGLLERYRREAPPDMNALKDPEVAQVEAALQVSAPLGAGEKRAPAPESPPVSQKARSWFQDAQFWQQLGEPGEMAQDLIAQALADSPAFPEAAVLSYALTGAVPERTVQALWNDGEALLFMAQRVRALKEELDDRTRSLLLGWLDRAVELGIVEARFLRGTLRLSSGRRGDRARGLDDLVRYVAATPQPAGLDEARALLVGAQKEKGRPDPALLRARLHLLAGRPQLAAQVLGGRCDAATRPDRLLPLGTVREWAGELEQAAACYAAARRRDPQSGRTPLTRLAGIGARAPLPLLARLEPELTAAAAEKVPGAAFALARLFLLRGQADRALPHLERFLALADAGDPSRKVAQAERDRITLARAREARERTRRRLALLLGGALLVGGLLYVYLRGAPLSRALRRRPALFPAVARAISELRHDVLKHRTSVLSILTPAPGPDGAREQVRRVLCEPTPCSELLARAYAGLTREAKGHGLTLRRLSREPAFGPLFRDLRRAEALVRRPLPHRREGQRLSRIEARLRTVHAERLSALLRQGPRTRLDPILLAGWIHDVEAELRLKEARWAKPVLLLYGLDLEFPVEEKALFTIFANLLRNAQAAVAPGGGVAVRIAEERDPTGRRLLSLLLLDSAEGRLDIEDIEGRESGRGLAIVRDLVHTWRGHLLLRREGPPWRKGVGACFPA